MVFDGFMRVWGGTKEDILLPSLKTGDKLKLESIQAKENFSRGPARYSEASLVRKLEELGIGRPSTYAPTISTIQSRGYVEKTDLEGQPRKIRILKAMNGKLSSQTEEEIVGADKGKLVPTPIAEITTDFLIKYFPSIVNYDFTAKVEEDFDEIARGKRQWNQMIKEFYQDFHPLIEKTEKVSRHEVSQARLIGNDPTSKRPIYARFGRYGPMLQKGEADDEQKPEFAPLPAGKTIDNVTLEDALEMFKLPRIVGTTPKGEEILANIGRYGPYIKVGKTSMSIKGQDPHQISLEQAIQIYQEKLTKEANKQIKALTNGIQVLNGPYGPYVTDGKRNVRVNKDQDPATITLQEAEAMLAKAPARRRRYQNKKSK